MKRNTFMKRLAVTALAATMTLGTVPATAVATFADTKAEVSDSDTKGTNSATVLAAVQNAVQTVAGTTTVDASANDIANQLESAMGKDYVVAVNGGVTDGALTKKDDGSYVLPRTATIQVEYKYGDGLTEVHDYDIELDVPVNFSAMTNAQKIAIVASDVQDALNKKEFRATGEIPVVEIKSAVQEVLNSYNGTAKADLLKNTAGNLTYTYTVASIADGSTESTEVTRGTVKGTVTLNLPAVAEDKDAKIKADPAASQTVNFSADRAFNKAVLDTAKKNAVINYLKSLTFPNTATPDDIAAAANEYIKQQGTNDDSWNGITATVGQLTRVTPQKHGGDLGSFTATASFTDGTNILADSFEGKLKHADSEKLAELDSAITTEAGKYSATKIQAKNATDPADTKDVAEGIKTILQNAIAEKVNNVKLSDGDKWTNAGISVKEGTTASTDIHKNNAKVAANTIEASYDYTKATPKKDGSVKVNVTYAVVSDADPDKTENKTTSFTITLPKLKAQKTTYLSFTKSAVPYTYDPSKDEAGNTYDLTDKSLLRRNGNDELVWTSSNPSAVTVNSDGKAVLKGVGEATITVTDADNNALTASIIVNSNEYYIFKDVQNAGSYYFNPVYEAKKAGVTSGVSDDEFGVGTSVTRAQMITWLWNAAGQPSASTKSNFTDVSENAFYAKAVNWAVSEGITAGKTATTFGSNDPVTRAQLVQFLYKEYGQGVKYNATINFTDVSEKAYYYDAVQWAVAKGVTAGKTATKFAPNDDCTREQGITFLYKASNGFVKANETIITE